MLHLDDDNVRFRTKDTNKAGGHDRHSHPPSIHFLNQTQGVIIEQPS